MTRTRLGSETSGCAVSLPQDGEGGLSSPSFSHRTVFSEV